MALEKRGDDFLEKDVLVEENPSFGDFPLSIRVPPQHVVPLPDEEVYLIVEAVGIDEKSAPHLHFIALNLADLHVGNYVANPGEWFFAPVDSGVDLAHAPRQGIFSLVEPGNLRL